MSPFNRCATFALSVAWWQAAAAAQVMVTIVDGFGAPVGDAVVVLSPASGSAAAAAVTRSVVLDQVKKQFIPHVLVIQVGTTLTFPNSDNIRHQVYSFSEAKRFQLKLYSGQSAAPVLFDKPGVVILGCNIHDWMSAYLYVVETPFFAVTNAAGHAVIEAPPDSYGVNTWHPRLARGREPLKGSIQIAAGGVELRQTLLLSALDDSNGMPPP